VNISLSTLGDADQFLALSGPPAAMSSSSRSQASARQRSGTESRKGVILMKDVMKDVMKEVV
jgi:hypothetical protein